MLIDNEIRWPNTYATSLAPGAGGNFFRMCDK